MAGTPRCGVRIVPRADTRRPRTPQRGVPTLERQKIFQQLHPFLGQNRFGMELDAVDGKIAVPKPHDFPLAGFSGDLQAFGKRFAANDQRMVAGRVEWIG